MGQQMIYDAHRELLKLKRLNNFLDTLTFKRVYAILNEADKSIADKYIQDKDAENLKTWIKEHKYQCVEEMTIRDLRLKGRALGVPNYSRLGRIELIRRILILIDLNLENSETQTKEKESET